MRNQRGIATLIIVIAIVIIGASSIAGAAYISNRNNDPERAAAGSNRSAEVSQGIGQGLDKTPRPTKSPKPTGTPKPITGSVTEESGVTPSGWAYTGFRDVIADPHTRADQKAIILEFERKNFSNIANIYYNLSYDTSESGVKRGVEGNVKPTSIVQTSQGGLAVITVEVELAACSQGVCKYYGNPNNFELVVTSTRTGAGTEYTQTLTKQTL